jgi:hypothetical protein
MELKDKPDVPVAELHQRTIVQGAQVGIGDTNLPLVRAIESAQHVKQCALPHA